jgi:hypothetical protein
MTKGSVFALLPHSPHLAFLSTSMCLTISRWFKLFCGKKVKSYKFKSTNNNKRYGKKRKKKMKIFNAKNKMERKFDSYEMVGNASKQWRK